MIALGSAALIAFLAAAIGSGLVVWAGPLDRPRARGLHEGAIATSGGLALVSATAAGVWRLAGSGGATGLAEALALATAMGLLGALDDLWDLSARTKLLVQAVSALAFAVLVARVEAIPLTSSRSLPLGPTLGALGTALWIVVAANAVNFMDGANGLAAGAAAIASAAFGFAALACGSVALGAAALVLSAAQLGLLPWNLGGRLFQGDAGALFSSTLLAALGVLGASAPSGVRVPIWTAPLALVPLLTDVLLTLASRARRRKPLFDAHREHLYQLWLASSGRSHGALAWRGWLLMGVSGLAALAIQGRSAGGQLAAFVVATGVSALGWAALRRRYAAEP